MDRPSPADLDEEKQWCQTNVVSGPVANRPEYVMREMIYVEGIDGFERQVCFGGC